MQDNGKPFHDVATDELRPFVTDEAVLELLRSAARNRIRRVSELAASAGVSRRTLQREFERHGLPEPSQWVQLIGMLEGMHALMTNPDMTVRVAAKEIAGYPDPFTFSNQMVRLVGVRPTAAIEQKLSMRSLIQKWITLQIKRDGPGSRLFGNLGKARIKVR